MLVIRKKKRVVDEGFELTKDYRGIVPTKEIEEEEVVDYSEIHKYIKDIFEVYGIFNIESINIKENNDNTAFICIRYCGLNISILIKNNIEAKELLKTINSVAQIASDKIYEKHFKSNN